MKKLLLVTLLLVLAWSPMRVKAQDKAYAQALKEMFVASGSEETYKAVLDQLFSMYRQEYTEVDPKIWDEYEMEFKKTSIDDLTEMLVPVYSKYLSLEEVKEITKFYATPAGSKLAKNTPLIMQESMQVGQKWGMEIGERITKEIEKRQN